ncbi:MAG: dienelactone hydrolase family protein [Proteobacteria bacterium]|nr:dienelactone hydrolase family protein [Pseudomonadota bacterium]
MGGPANRRLCGSGLVPVLCLLLCLLAPVPARAAGADLEAGLERQALLKLPTGQGPFPGLVMLSGCRGVGRNDLASAERLTGLGYACLIVDSMGPRGLDGGVCTRLSMLRPEVRAGDAGWGFRFLKARPEIDPNRIGLLGWSHGGSTVLATIGRDLAPDGGGFRAAAVFYPHCGFSLPERIGPPLLMLLGGLDDICPAGLCLDLAERLNRAGDSVQTMVLPRARHAFDHADLPPVVTFLSGTAGYDPGSAQAAREALEVFLKRHLGN